MFKLVYKLLRSILGVESVKSFAKTKESLPKEIHAAIGRSVIEEIKEEFKEPAEREKFVKRLRKEGFSEKRIKELFPEFISSNRNPR